MGFIIMFRRTILPLLLALIFLAVFNVGLYTQLAGSPRISTVTLPYFNDFSDPEILGFPRFGGDWDIRDEQLVQISTSGFDLGILLPMEIPAEQSYQASVDLRYLGGSMGGGIIFNANNAQTRQRSHMARFNIDNNQLYIIYGYFGDDSDFRGQGSISLDIPPNTSETMRLGVLVGTENYRILLNDAIITDDIGLQYYGGTVGMITSASQVAFDNLRVEAWSGQADVTAPSPTPVPVTENNLPDVALSENTVFGDSFDNIGDGDNPWVPFSGNWIFEDGGFIQTQAEGFDLGAGYNQLVSNHSVQVTLTHIAGQGGGVLFNMAEPNSQRRAHMVRYVHDADFLTWGYFDEDGQFTGQGSAPVPTPDTMPHTLTIRNTGDAYFIDLDGSILAENIPVVMRGGYAGLVTAQSHVRFDDFRLFTIDGVVETSPQPEANINQFEAVNGTWAFGEEITQSDNDTTDYIAGTGIAGETYRISVTIDLPDGLDDAGAGIIFHMAGRDDHANGQMVRFSNGGQELFWGTYDENRQFTGAGSTPLGIDMQVPNTLTLTVRAETYDIAINDETIVQDIPVDSRFGWVGLIAFRGPVSFTNFTLGLGN
jgi:hypothetical protein